VTWDRYERYIPTPLIANKKDSKRFALFSALETSGAVPQVTDPYPRFTAALRRLTGSVAVTSSVRTPDKKRVLLGCGVSEHNRICLFLTRASHYAVYGLNLTVAKSFKGRALFLIWRFRHVLTTFSVTVSQCGDESIRLQCTHPIDRRTAMSRSSGGKRTSAINRQQYRIAFSILRLFDALNSIRPGRFSVCAPL